MTTALITLPHLEEDGITFDAHALSHWLPPSVAPNPELLALKINALLRQTLHGCLDMNRSRGWRPKSGQLGLALTTLVYAGVDMGPASKECCLLSYWDKDAEHHNVVPYVMKAGLKRLAGDRYPISHDTTRIVIEGDRWEYEETSDGPVIRWQAGKDRSRGQLINVSKALGVIQALWTRITMVGRPAFNGVLEGFHLREVLLNNQAATSRKAVWGSSFVGMLRKTSVVHTYRSLPLSGRPAAAMNLDGMAERHELGSMRSHLLAAGREEGLPAEAIDAVEAMEGVTDEPVPDMPEGEDGAYGGDSEFKFVPQDEPPENKSK